jgi:hypothetical protein
MLVFIIMRRSAMKNARRRIRVALLLVLLLNLEFLSYVFYARGAE